MTDVKQTTNDETGKEYQGILMGQRVRIWNDGIRREKSTWIEPIHALIKVRERVHDWIGVNLHCRWGIIFKKSLLIVGLEYLSVAL